MNKSLTLFFIMLVLGNISAPGNKPGGTEQHLFIPQVERRWEKPEGTPKGHLDSNAMTRKNGDKSHEETKVHPGKCSGQPSRCQQWYLQQPPPPGRTKQQPSRPMRQDWRLDGTSHCGVPDRSWRAPATASHSLISPHPITSRKAPPSLSSS